MYHHALKILENKLGRKSEPVCEICMKLSLLYTNLNNNVEAQNFANRATCNKERASSSNEKPLVSNQQQR